MTTRRPGAAVIGLILAVVVVSAAGADTRITLQLKWLPQAQFMGYYVAAQKGYYKAEGLDVLVLPGGVDIIPEQQVFNGTADIGVTWLSSLLAYQDKGWKFVGVAQMFQKSALVLVSRASSGILSPRDLAGRKVGSWFGGNEYPLYALLESAGLDRNRDLELVRQDYSMDQVIRGDIDAASAMTYNELGLLLESGFTRSQLNVIDMNAAGVAMLEDHLFVTSSWLEKNRDVLVRFLRASIKGWKEACRDPEAAGALVYNLGRSVSLAHQVYMAREIARLVAPPGFDPDRIGYMDPAALKQTADYAVKYGLLTKPSDLAAAVDTSSWEQAVGMQPRG